MSATLGKYTCLIHEQVPDTGTGVGMAEDVVEALSLG